ncbi:hypothetical protein BDY19DRAFT_886069 [Irpex rosettiformis]|uniref:Uncharacterized protein n=1 Tax=Irpex rosettiformis TaxID=378272 RepID=A0ACB8UAE9_9APHY|nr:hypothetical protein BDY19DRAFT_886069 [Irpex rosettiformis]
MYPNPNSPRAKETYNNVDTSQKAHLKGNPRLPHVGRNAWAWMTVGIEVKYTTVKSAFLFENNTLEEETPILRNSEEGEKSQTQLAKYATEMMVHQHRTFVFIVYIAGDQARITRWDRAGCIVSTPINLTNEPWKLLKFVYYLGLMSNEELGYDTAAVLATEDEVNELIAFKPRNKYAAQCAKDIVDNRVYYPIYKVRPFPRDSVHFIGKHSAASSSPTGRATKGYVTFNMRSKIGSRLSFLKEYWRPILPNSLTELDIYELLKAKGVLNIATIIGVGGVNHQFTMTEEFLGREKLAKRGHCLILFEELARPLADYDDSSNMILAVSSALIAHRGAWLDAGILHRDISVNNIMFVLEDGADDTDVRAILNDWDLAKPAKELGSGATQARRSGTWAFMSAVSLQYPLKPNELADDLEAFIHVVTYLSFQWHRHSLTRLEGDSVYSPKELVEANSSPGVGGLYIGGVQKLKDNIAGIPPVALEAEYVSPLLIQLVSDLYRLLKTHYSTIDFEELKTKYSPSNKRHTAPLPRKRIKTKRRAEQQLPEDLHKSFLQDPIVGVAASTNTERDSLPTLLAPQTPHRVLDTHFHIMNAFEKAVASIQQLEEVQGDVIQDQFYGLGEIVVAGPKGASGSKRKSQSSANNGSKPKKVKSLVVDDTKSVGVSGELYVVVEGKEDGH